MHRRRRLVNIFKIGSVLIVLAGLGWGLSWLSYRPFWNIATVDVHGTVSVAAPSVQVLAANDINGAYGWLISKSNQILYPRGKIAGDIEKNFPQVAAVQLAVSSDHVLTVNVTERQPAYRWCAAPDFAPNFPDAPTALATNQCYFMDNLGLIFMPVPGGNEVLVATSSMTTPTTGPQLFRFYGRVASTSVPVGASYTNKTDFAALAQLVFKMASQHLPSYALVSRPDGVDELFLNQGGAIIFDDGQDLTQVATDVAALQQSTTIFANGSKLEYVDVRLGNKAFYKLVDTATSTASQ